MGTDASPERRRDKYRRVTQSRDKSASFNRSEDRRKNTRDQGRDEDLDRQHRDSWLEQKGDRGRGRNDDNDRHFDEARNERRGRADVSDRDRAHTDIRTNHGREHRGGAHRKERETNGRGVSQRAFSRWADEAPSSWGTDVTQLTPELNGNNGFVTHPFHSTDRTGGMYGPADTGRPRRDQGWVGGGGGERKGQRQEAPRDESWVERRLKLRAEARAPKGVWNRSPSPPKKRETKVAKAPPVKETGRSQHGKLRAKEGLQTKEPDRKRESRRVKNDSKASQQSLRHKARRKRPRSVSLSSSVNSSVSESDSSSSSDNSVSGSASASGSSSGGSGGSSSDSDGDGEDNRKLGVKRKSSTLSARKPDEDEVATPQLGGLAAREVSSPQLAVDPGNDASYVDPRAEQKAGIPHAEFDEMDAAEAAQFKADVQGHRHHETKDSDDEAGPMPVPQLDELQGEGERGVNYGGALLPGEGAAIAQFVQKGLRIPRRGEVGWTGGEIERLEDSGYVMSGSRHARMNAVRLRKENQVFNAEERRALALIMFEEKQQKENEILGNFRQMLTETSQEGDKPNGEDARNT